MHCVGTELYPCAGVAQVPR